MHSRSNDSEQLLKAYLKPAIRRTMLSQYRPNSASVTINQPDLQTEVYMESQIASPWPLQTGMSAL